MIPVPQKDSGKTALIVVVSVLATLVVVLLVYLLFMRPPPPPVEAVEQPASKNMITLSEAQNFISMWCGYQSRNDFSSYRDLYDHSFRGIKRVRTGRATTYNFEAWMKDRAKMYAGTKYVNVSAENIRLLYVDNTNQTASISFFQTFVMKNYQDQGTKVMKLKKLPSGLLLIVTEELLYSAALANRTGAEPRTTSASAPQSMAEYIANLKNACASYDFQRVSTMMRFPFIVSWLLSGPSDQLLISELGAGVNKLLNEDFLNALREISTFRRLDNIDLSNCENFFEAYSVPFNSEIYEADMRGKTRFNECYHTLVFARIYNEWKLIAIDGND